MLRRGMNPAGMIATAFGIFALTSAYPACAADYPARAIDLYVGSAPAGSTDVLGRVLARSLETVLDQTVVVHNTPGAGGAVMAAQLRNSAPDGYSLGMTISHAYSGNPVVLPDSTGYTVDDFTHLASVSKGQCALVTHSGTPYLELSDLVEAARRGERPVFASQSPLTRIVADFIASVAGVKFRVITVQGGGEMMQTILGGHADFGFSGGPHIDHVAAGQMRVLASTEDARLASSPDVPTLRELGYDISSCSLFVVSAPPGLPGDIEQPLSAALKQAIQSSEMRTLIENLKFPEHYLGPDDVTRVLRDEADTLERAVVRISQPMSDASGANLSPAFMPYLAAVSGLGALALMFAAGLTRSGRSVPVQLRRESWVFILAATSVLGMAFMLMNQFGYLFGAAAIVAGFMTLARAGLKTMIATTIVFPLVLWLLFEKLLGFPLP